MSSPRRKLNLLVVDDDPSITRLVTNILSTSLADDIAITALNSPAEAQKWIHRHCCDLLLSDIEMPGIDGLEMLRFAKGQNAWTQVVFLTGHSTWDRIAEAVEYGASDYLLKPIDRNDLVTVIENVCTRIRRWQSAVLDTLRMPAAT